MDLILAERIEPILKWPGGKQDELPIIHTSMPDHIKNYYEPFLGGGAVFLSMPPEIPAFINDLSSDLMNLYAQVAQQDVDFFAALDDIIRQWLAIEAELATIMPYLLTQYKDFRSKTITETSLRTAVYSCIDDLWDSLGAQLGASLTVDNSFYQQMLGKSLFQKLKRMQKLELKKGVMSVADIQANIEGAIKAAFYYYIRHLYNHAARFQLTKGVQAAVFFFLRENAYAAMFRFNKQGHFNVPYGGISYNRKNIEAKIDRLRQPELVARLQNATFGNTDFLSFIDTYSPQRGDFIFLDPPYDTEFSSYDQNPFDQADQRRLANYLIKDCPANFMLVIKATEFIRSLYEDTGLFIHGFDKKYMYTIKSRNERDVVHLLITNYPVEVVGNGKTNPRS